MVFVLKLPCFHPCTAMMGDPGLMILRSRALFKPKLGTKYIRVCPSDEYSILTGFCYRHQSANARPGLHAVQGTRMDSSHGASGSGGRSAGSS